MNDNQSSGSTINVNGNFQTSLKVPSNNVYTSHSTIPDPSASDIEVRLDGNVITNYTVRINITRNGTKVAAIHPSVSGAYTINYEVLYKGRVVSNAHRTITVH